MTLLITKVAGETDAFVVTLQDSRGGISQLNGRTTLEFPVSVSGAPTDVMTHNGEMMKNSLISGGKGYGTTTGLSKFAVAANPVSFADVANHWGKPYIQFLAARNIINGVAPDKFAPNNHARQGDGSAVW